MSGEAFVLGLLGLLTLLLSVVIWNVFAVARARARADHDSTAACARLTAELESLRADVEQLMGRPRP